MFRIGFAPCISLVRWGRLVARRAFSYSMSLLERPLNQATTRSFLVCQYEGSYKTKKASTPHARSSVVLSQTAKEFANPSVLYHNKGTT